MAAATVFVTEAASSELNCWLAMLVSIRAATCVEIEPANSNFAISVACSLAADLVFATELPEATIYNGKPSLWFKFNS